MIGVAVNVTARGIQVFGRVAGRLTSAMASGVRRTARNAAPILKRRLEAAVQTPLGAPLKPQSLLRQAITKPGVELKLLAAETMVKIEKTRRYVIERGPRILGQAGIHALRLSATLYTSQKWIAKSAYGGIRWLMSTKPEGPLKQRVMIRAERDETVETTKTMGWLFANIAAELGRRRVNTWRTVEGAQELLQMMFPRDMPIPGTIQSRGTGTGVEYYVGGKVYHILGAFKMPQRNETMDHANREISVRPVVMRRGSSLVELELLRDYMQRVSSPSAMGQTFTPKQLTAQPLTPRPLVNFENASRAFSLIRNMLRRELLTSIDSVLVGG